MSKRHDASLDDRRRDRDGEIRHKRRDTLVRTLRGIYGEDFAPGTRSDATLGTVLARSGARTLNEYLSANTTVRRTYGKHVVSKGSRAILEETTRSFGRALKHLADK